MIIKIDKDIKLVDFLNESCTKITGKDGVNYFYSPFWFKEEGNYLSCTMLNLPPESYYGEPTEYAEMINIIEDMRHKPINEYENSEYPLTVDECFKNK